MLPPEFISILACPVCRSDLIQTEDGSSLLCASPCGRLYPVINGIPVLLADRLEESAPADGEAA